MEITARAQNTSRHHCLSKKFTVPSTNAGSVMEKMAKKMFGAKNLLCLKIAHAHMHTSAFGIVKRFCSHLSVTETIIITDCKDCKRMNFNSLNSFYWSFQPILLSSSADGVCTAALTIKTTVLDM